MQILRRELAGDIQELLYVVAADSALAALVISEQDGGAASVVQRERWLLNHDGGAPRGDGAARWV